MLESAATIVDLVSNLLDPGGFVAAVLGNAYAYQARRDARLPTAGSKPDEAVLVRIELVSHGTLPRYRIEHRATRRSLDLGGFWVFDGKNHKRVSADCDDVADANWSSRTTPLGDVENLALVIRRFDSLVGGMIPGSASAN